MAVINIVEVSSVLEKQIYIVDVSVIHKLKKGNKDTFYDILV